MKKININIPSGKYLVAVSGGPDSMALLDIVRKNNYYIEVAHVNYHKRSSAKNDEKLVRKYCRNNKIKFHLLNVYPEEVKGNFQDFARKKRYEYFNKLCLKNKLEAVLVAHHLDDHLETYLMQKQKNMGVNHYGLNRNSIICGVNVIRPLLKYEKKDLINYCEFNNIKYGIDESNLTDSYTRNKIRHSKIDKMNLADKKLLLKEIDNKNKEKDKINKIISKYSKSYEIDDFLKLKYLKEYLRLLFPNKSDKYYQEMIRQLKNNKQALFNQKDLYLVKEYGKVNIFNKPYDYVYTFKNIKEMNNKTFQHFKLRKTGKSIERVSLDKDDFPITIRNYKPKDSIKMRYGTKKINRFFIDNKIGLYDRMRWPIMFDKKGSAILVPGIGCNISHYFKKEKIFMIKL